MHDARLAAAVRALHDAHAPALQAWARQHVADPAEAEEIVQETLVRAWRRQDQFDPARGSERAWLFGIARNLVIDGHRKQQRRLRAVSSLPPVDPAGDDELARAVETSHVREALRSLSHPHRAVIIETYYRGHSVREAARLLGLPEGTVKSRLFYGLRALRDELERREVLP
jgi:RNA polymerase sigma-70 factor, ECF subfamily